MTIEYDGWNNFTLEQAKSYIAEMKKEHPRRWTGLGRCAEQMTELAEKLSNRVRELESKISDHS